jgi:hypothetical protein
MRVKNSLSNYRELKAIAAEGGASVFGVADISGIKDTF